MAAGDGRFRLVGSAPRHERLLFKHGEIVECEIRTLPGGSKGLVAMRSVSADPEYRKTRNVFATFGAIIGAIVGAAIALSFVFSLVSAAAGTVVGAVIFALCSIRWGDAAWDVLSRVLRRE